MPPDARSALRRGATPRRCSSYPCCHSHTTAPPPASDADASNARHGSPRRGPTTGQSGKMLRLPLSQRGGASSEHGTRCPSPTGAKYPRRPTRVQSGGDAVGRCLSDTARSPIHPAPCRCTPRPDCEDLCVEAENLKPARISGRAAHSRRRVWSGSGRRHRHLSGVAGC